MNIEHGYISNTIYIGEFAIDLPAHGGHTFGLSFTDKLGDHHYYGVYFGKNITNRRYISLNHRLNRSNGTYTNHTRHIPSNI